MRLRLPFVLLSTALLAACAGVGSEPGPGQPAHHVRDGFRNPNPEFKSPGGWTRWSFFVRRMWTGLASPRRFDAPRVDNDGRALQSAAGPSVTWIGHSTLLLQLDGVNILTDPHWGMRASPLSWAGPRRLGPPGVAFEALPPIHVVVISHDHYDHLDLPTVKRLAAAHDPLFLVPLGLKSGRGAAGRAAATHARGGRAARDRRRSGPDHQGRTDRALVA